MSNEGKFTYESDGKAVDWTNWHKGEPNDWGKGEDCVRSGHGHGGVNKWNDSPCNDKYSIICEKSGKPIYESYKYDLFVIFHNFSLIFMRQMHCLPQKTIINFV